MSKGENMKRMSIKEFKTKSNIEIIEELMKVNNGYVTSKLISELGIHRMYLNIMKEKGIIEKVGNGIYIDSNKIEDNYFNYKIKKHNVFYVDKDIYKLGLTEVETPMGNSVRAYDVEKCICDIIRSKNRMDSEHVKYSIREYIKSKDKDLVKLSKYADKIGVKEEVMNLLEWFYE